MKVYPWVLFILSCKRLVFSKGILITFKIIRVTNQYCFSFSKLLYFSVKIYPRHEQGVEWEIIVYNYMNTCLVFNVSYRLSLCFALSGLSFQSRAVFGQH